MPGGGEGGQVRVTDKEVNEGVQGDDGANEGVQGIDGANESVNDRVEGVEGWNNLFHRILKREVLPTLSFGM